MNEKILEVANLKKYFLIKSGLLRRTIGCVRAVDGPSFSVDEGEVLGLVGESGSGKTTLGECVVRLVEPTEGKVIFQGVDILRLSKKKLRPLRSNFQIVFQNPFLSLSPRMNVMSIVEEPLRAHTKMSEKERDERVLELLRLVGLEEEHRWKYPHELSGGQCQRIAVARALALNPKFVVLDEPSSSLDVSVQAQILNLLKDLQRRLGLTYLYITHDLGVAQYISDRVAVMYMGKIVEIGSMEEVFEKSLHPYTQGLIAAIPMPNPDAIDRSRRKVLKGDIPSPMNPPSGCRFRTRCPLAAEVCASEEPTMTEMRKKHFVACHFAGQAG